MNNLVKNNLLVKATPINLILLIIILLGIGLRLFHFFYNRSLWMDETYLASSLIRMNYLDLAEKPLYYQQKAPIGFLWAVRFLVDNFGNKETVLRIIPLISGIASILLFNKINKYFLKPAGQLLAISIFCFAPALIYHSVEIKQYATESLATIMALYLFITFKDNRKLWKGKVIWGILGAIILWFSYSVIFVLVGIAAAVTLDHLMKKDWKLFFRDLIPFSFWMFSFIINYFLFTHKHAESKWIVYWFQAYENFMPLPPHSLHDLNWYPLNLYRLMDYPLGLVWNSGSNPGSLFWNIVKIPFIPILLGAAGTYFLFKKNRNRFFVLLFPVMLMLLASGLKLYPLTERFWVFIAPVLILLIAIGFDYSSTGIKYAGLQWALLIVVVLIPLSQSVSSVLHPDKFYKHKKSFERESLLYVNTHFKTDDAVYIYWNNLPGYRFYKNLYPFKYKGIEGHDFRKSSANFQEYNKKLMGDLAVLSSKKRVWLLYNTQFQTDIGDLVDDPAWYYTGRLKTTDNLVSEFSKLGKVVKKIVTPDVTLYLFELYSAKPMEK